MSSQISMKLQRHLTSTVLTLWKKVAETNLGSLNDSDVTGKIVQLYLNHPRVLTILTGKILCFTEFKYKNSLKCNIGCF